MWSVGRIALLAFLDIAVQVGFGMKQEELAKMASTQ
jgi:hypothetical protein